MLGNNLAVGDRIFILGVQLAGINSDVVNKWLNRPEGHIVGNGGFSALTGTFRLHPDVSSAGLTLPNLTANIYIAKNRIRIPMRFRCVLPRTTNYIQPW